MTAPAELGPFVPRVVREWDDDPSTLHRRIEGTCVFVDVSGFTAMSERLARLGREGAEAVTAIIGSSFDRLLDEAYAYGGTLLKFGGDALLLFYRDESHELRAAAGAVGMRRVLRDHGTFDTNAGLVRLRMSVGIESGAFDFFLVGDTHRELIIGGSAATSVVSTEGAAGTGRILSGTRHSSRLRRANLGAPVAGGRLVRGTFPDLERTSVHFLDPGIDLSPFVQPELRRRIAAGVVEPEHRLVTIGFLQFAGLDDLIARIGPEEAAEVLDALVRSVQEACTEHDVYFVGSDIAAGGGKLILTAGAPAATGADEEELLLAASRIVARGAALPFRIGINRGPVFAGEIGTTFRRSYTVMGDAVNLAARIMARAEYGSVLAHESVLDGSRTLFETSPVPPFLVKGKRLPVSAFAVGEPRGVREPIAAASLPLVGRDEELALLRSALEAAAAGRGSSIDVAAEPGTGKSRLVDEALRFAGAAAVRRIEARRYQAATPYFVAGTLLRAALGPAADDAARLAAAVRKADESLTPWIPLIGTALGHELADTEATEPLTEQARKDRLERSVVDLVDAVLDGPTVIALGDAQWMDEPSADLLLRLSARVPSRPWLLIVTRRSGEGTFTPGDDWHHIELRPLGRDALVALVTAATADAPLPGHVVERMADRSEGNPLFLLELIGAVREGSDEDLPDSIEGLIAARLDRLPRDDLALLRQLSVLGAGFQREHAGSVLAPAAARGPWLNRLGAFLESERSGWIRFRHSLVRDVAYRGLPYRTRRELHGRVADSIASSVDDMNDAAPLLSLHNYEAGRNEPAWRFSRLAGDRARDLFDNVDAATFYERGLRAARRLEVPAPELVSVYESLGAVRERAGLYDAANRAFRAGRNLAGNPLTEARLILAIAQTEGRRGRYTPALRWVTKGLSLLDGRSDHEARSLRAQLALRYASVRREQGKPDSVLRWCDRVLAVEAPEDDLESRARAQLLRGLAEQSMGLSPVASFENALQLSEAAGFLVGQALSHNNLGLAAYYSGAWDAAVSSWERSRSLYERLGDPAGAAFADVNIGEVLSDQGHLERAEELFRRALPVWQAAGDTPGVGYLNSQLGRVAARAGRYEEAEDHLRFASAIFHEIGAAEELLEADARLAELRLFAGEFEEAATYAAAVGERAEKLEGGVVLFPLIERVAGEAAMLLGDLAGAATALDRSLGHARDLGIPFEIAQSLDAAARLAEKRGSPARETAEERDRILDGLGVVRLARPGGGG